MTHLIVGAGAMAESYVAVLRHLGESFELLGRSEAGASRAESRMGVPVMRGGLDALPAEVGGRYATAIVAVNIESLAGVSRSLAERGIRKILIEKPAGLDASEIVALGRDLAAANVEAYVAYNRRFFASTAAVRRAIAEDGGVSSFHMEFTEIESRVLSVERPAAVLANFTLGNSSHVVDLAFHLAGRPIQAEGAVAGSLPWHPSASVFAGYGRTATGALFTWHADWGSAGRWFLDIRTSRRRLLMAPLEGVTVQQKGSFSLDPMPLDDADDKSFKPGLLRQVQAFLSDDPRKTALPSLAEHVGLVKTAFMPVFAPGSTGNS